MGLRYRFAFRVIHQVKSARGLQNSLLVLLILTNVLIISGLEVVTIPKFSDPNPESSPAVDT
jgi:hypothetical protein